MGQNRKGKRKEKRGHRSETGCQSAVSDADERVIAIMFATYVFLSGNGSGESDQLVTHDPRMELFRWRWTWETGTVLGIFRITFLFFLIFVIAVFEEFIFSLVEFIAATKEHIIPLKNVFRFMSQIL